MKKLGAVALVGVGLIVLVQSLPFLSSIGWSLSMFANGEVLLGTIQLIWSLVIFGAMLLIGLYLIRKRHVLADRWFSDTEIPHSLSEQGLLRVALAVVGVYLVATAVPDFVGTIGSFATMWLSDVSGMDSYFTPESRWQFVSGILTSTVAAGAGFYLITRNASLADRIWMGRPATPGSAKTTSVRSQCPSCGADYDPDDYSDLASARCTECHQPLRSVDV